MIIRMLLLLIVSMWPFINQMEAVLTSNLFASKNEKSLPPKIRVLLVHDRPGVILEVKGRYRLYDPNTNDFITNRYTGKRSYILCVKEGLKWGESFPGLYQLKIVPDYSEVTTIVDGVEYRGTIYVYDVEGRISVVNEIDIEDYLRSTLAMQLRDPMPSEALAAHVIAARTHAYYQATHPKNSFWDLDAQTSGYYGEAVITPHSPIEHALHATRYMVLSNNVETTIDSLWSKSSLSNTEVVEMARKGKDASQILEKAFPKTAITLSYK